MKIVVCVKQVPDTVEVKIDSKTNNLVREGVPSILNPCDENALEAALELRDQAGGTVTAVTMGPAQAEEALIHCMEMGADQGVLLCDSAVRGSDTLATGYALSELIKFLGCDLVVCGNEAVDGCTGQVGPQIAGNLGAPQFTYASGFQMKGDLLQVRRDVGAYVEYYETRLPAVVCMLKDSNTPRPRIRRACRAQVVTAAGLELDPDRIGNSGSPTRVVSIEMSDARAKSYVSIDDSLPWEDRIRMIINGGVINDKKADLWRGTAAGLAKRLMEHPQFNRFLEEM